MAKHNPDTKKIADEAVKKATAMSIKPNEKTFKKGKYKVPPCIPTPTERPTFPELEKLPEVSDQEFIHCGKILDSFVQSAKAQKLAKTVYDDVMKATNDKGEAKMRRALVEFDIQCAKKFAASAKMCAANNIKMRDYEVRLALWKAANKKKVTPEERLLCAMFGDKSMQEKFDADCELMALKLEKKLKAEGVLKQGESVEIKKEKKTKKAKPEAVLAPSCDTTKLTKGAK